MSKLTEDEIKEIGEIELAYDKADGFIHCKHCLESFLGSNLNEVMAPRDYGIYEASNYEFTYPDGHMANIVVVWCKRCGRQVWDSRFLKHIS